MTDPTIEMKWKHGQIIREIATGKPYLVLHVYRNIATMLADLTGDAPCIVLLPFRYSEYAPDLDMKQTVTKTNAGIEEEWEHEPITL